MPLIEFKDLCIGYEHKVIIKNINLEINDGEYVCVFGDNGVGKTTFLKTILGLIPPLSGSIIIEDTFNKKEVGYLPQRMQLKPEFPASCFEIVLSGCVNRLKIWPFYRKSHRDLAIEKMKLLGVANLKDKPFRVLSGGQQQRILLARALCATDRLLILDEPFTGLDYHAAKSLYDLLEKINKQLNVTIIVVSHFMEDILAYSTKVVHLSKEEVFCGTPEQYVQKFDLNILKLKNSQIKEVEDESN